MTNQHPISAPDELLRQWCQWNPEQTPTRLWRKIADNAAQWGADQELDACCEVVSHWFDTEAISQGHKAVLRAARRPKPLREADQALEALDRMDQFPTAEDQHTIRRALERLKELEESTND